ncbi:hypothetical protein CFP65_3971 [Kitasatospora sp. MMS16-BH015]|uniref:hypothetical protein n=1 Tax=Kitasatospora sp. MMS16-BH015 TaxID=2018025 RepID=UPI000CA1C0D2|nr:hypothetical protein [Kitasatospora sp. MMS16-BH015]AUG78741.1 hypothetical protein CFP65_3971 [Kitasatospora sp. MMS16-BH015]
MAEEVRVPEAEQPELGQPQPEQQAGAEERPQPGRKPVGWVRLLVAAALLGPLLGAGVGYAVQAGRPATPLPPLQVALPAHPTAVLDAKAAAEAAPKPLNIDGDLRKLLIAKPGDAEDWDNFGRGDMSGWISVGEKAMTYGGADRKFSSLLTQGFRRDAIVSWRKGEVKYSVELIQYTDGHAAQAVDAVFGSPGGSHPIDGTVSGYYAAPNTPEQYAESTEKYYLGTAVAHRGDVVMMINVFSPNQVDENELKDLAKRQWERLV